MGPMSPTILDMEQIFRLRPSGIIVDITHDWALTLRPIVESSGTSSGTSALFLQLEYNSTTFQSYGTSFKGFIPFVKNNFGAGSSNANIDQEHIVCRTRADLEWGASFFRKCPWFLNQAFQDALVEDADPLCREKFINCIQSRDLAWGVRSDRYECELEVYHPNFCSRQLVFRQATPIPFFDSIHCGTSYRLLSPQEDIFQAAYHSLKVMSKVA
ncbi:hypothetical protein ACFX2G_019324 [Malus domestica]